MNDNSNIRIGVIGLGYLGKFHLEKYLKLKKDVKVTALVDISEEVLSDFVKIKDAKKTSNYREIVDDIDAVSIVTPTNTHYEIAKFFLESGKDVLLEKPITSTVEEADELVDISEKNGNIFQIGHLERFNPAVNACKSYIDKPMFIECIRIAPYIGRSIDTDVIRDLMIHDIDIILNIVKSKIKSIHAVGVPILTDKLDIANARLVFDSGCVVNITSSRVSFKKERKIRIFSNNRYISINYEKKSIQVYTLNKGDKKVIKAKDFLTCFKMKKLKFSSKTDQLQLEIESFVNCIKSRITPEVSGVEGRNALETALKILSNAEVNLNDTVC